MGCKYIMEMLPGKHFSITDPKGVNTVIYQINKTKKEFLKDYPKYTVERLDFTEEIRGENCRKTFYIDEPQPKGNQLVILSFGKENVVIKELSANLQTKIKQVIKKTSDLEVKEVNIKIKDVKPMDNIAQE